MPEGHTIHRIAKDHTPLLVGQVVGVSSPQGRFAADAALVDGVELRRIEPFGKHLFYWWANGLVGHVHLGLFGKFRVSHGHATAPVQGLVRMRLQTPLATVDLAGPTDCSIGSADERDAIVRRLGPDPLRRDASPTSAIERMRRSAQPIGALLLDQKVLAGVGNVYRAEALFVNGIHPSRPGRQCSVDELTALWRTIAAMLRQGVKDNRIITIDRREFRVNRGQARRGENTYVYHRDLCLRCGTAVQTVALGGRACYFCPTCQQG
ncbi:MAG: zinc finger domain-containing protein [Actinomycetota bacterium]|nr:zinc finger domain-containing protein [Actinomycetota bacterium]